MVSLKYAPLPLSAPYLNFSCIFCFSERALYSFESAFHPLFSLTSGTCRLDYRRPENRWVFLAACLLYTSGILDYLLWPYDDCSFLISVIFYKPMQNAVICVVLLKLCWLCVSCVLAVNKNLLIQFGSSVIRVLQKSLS